jgi:alpha-glucoside transport system permease protein
MTTTPPVAPDDTDGGLEHDAGDITPVGHHEDVSGGEAAIAAVAILAVVIIGYFAFGYLKSEDANQALKVIVAIILGAVGVWTLYWGFDKLVAALPRRIGNVLRPVVFVGPALALLAFYLVYPAINTLWLSFQNQRSDDWVGFDNYQRVFTERPYLIGIRNSIVWALIVPAAAVAIGLAFATLADKLGRKTESTAKSLIFMPMAISFVGASVVFTFIYSFRPAGFGEQIGLLNGIWTELGNDPVEWLAQKPWNNLYLMVILIWLQTGFSMVVLSSAIKGVPDDLLEAARIDGATEWQVFWKIVIPTIASTIVVVWTTVLITVWKVFDIVWVMTGGRDDTQVIAQQMVQEFFTNRDNGVGATLAVVLFIAVTPILILNIKRFKAQEEMR